MKTPLVSEAVDQDEDAPRRWIPRIEEMSAWGLSLVAHVVVLGLLGMIHFDVAGAVVTVIDSAFDEIDNTQYKFDVTATDQMGSDSNVNSLSASQEAATAIGKTPQEEISKTIDETIDIPVPMTDQVVEPAKAEMLSAVQTTGGTEHAGGVEGAIDRMAFEIANQLREKKTLVVWLFDVSPSLRDRREKIANRVENIYNQLNAMNVGADKALKTAVAVFGEKTTIVTNEPLDEPAEVVKAVRGIKSEESGKENVFTAVATVANKWQSQRTKMGRAIMIITVTDEAGSDVDKLEGAILATKRYGMRCYVIGDEAPLGRREVRKEFTLDSGEVIIGKMEQGPESYFQERLNLGYWGVNDYDLQSIPSGFGPYGLTRLCAETNGLFLVAQSDTSSRHHFDPLVMRSYPPDYRPIPMLEADMRKNGARLALVSVCEEFKGVNIPLPSTRFPAENDNVLRTNVTEAQRPLAELDYKLDQILRQLEVGEKDRAKLTEPRARATYDLALGRVLAMKVRSFGYNMMLAEMKSSPRKFEKQGSNLWMLQPSKDITSGAVAKKLATRANDYLKRVIDEHAGTPWATLAEREYSTPLGWQWVEGSYNPQAQGMGGNNNKKAPRFVEEVDPKTGKKVKKMISDTPTVRDI